MEDTLAELMQTLRKARVLASDELRELKARDLDRNACFRLHELVQDFADQAGSLLKVAKKLGAERNLIAEVEDLLDDFAELEEQLEEILGAGRR